MTHKRYNIGRTHRGAFGFTLIELLVVIAIIALLLSIILPALNVAKGMAKRIVCGSNLKQLTFAWHMYLEDYDGRFYRGLTANHDFGGWKGTEYPTKPRPLNSYVDLPLEIDTEEKAKEAKVFRCPADAGGISSVSEKILAFYYHGNSYQTNIILIGPTQIGLASPGLEDLHIAIDQRTEGMLKLEHVTVSWSRVALMGDNNWMHEWNPIALEHSKAWHGKKQHHNIAFIDGQVRFLKIRKGIYVSSDYTIVPFTGLLKMAKKVQVEIE